MGQWTCEVDGTEGTERLGRVLAEAVVDGTVLALVGTLGAGKTLLARAIAQAVGVDPREVISPTFVLVREYQGDRAVYHFDAYRLASEEEFLQLGAEEYFDRPGISLVEWADRVEGCLPADRLEIRIEVTGPWSRWFVFSGSGWRSEAVFEALRRASLEK